MVKKQISRESKKNHLELAKKHFHDGQVLLSEQLKSGVYDATPIKHLETAGKEYMQARKFYDAEISFREASRYAQLWRERKPEVISAKYRNRLQKNCGRMYRIGEAQLEPKLEKLWVKLSGAPSPFFTIIIIGLIAGVVFLQSGITGNSIVNLDTTITTSIGVVLLMAGLVAGFFLLKKKK